MNDVIEAGAKTIWTVYPDGTSEPINNDGPAAKPRVIDHFQGPPTNSNFSSIAKSPSPEAARTGRRQHPAARPPYRR